MRRLSRRGFLCAGAAFGLVSTSGLARATGAPLPRVIRPGNSMAYVRRVPESLVGAEEGAGVYDPALLPPPESPIDFPVPDEDGSIAPVFRAQTVPFPVPALAGIVVVDPGEHFLYLINGDGTARRYGVGVGREGFAWAGRAVVGLKRRWPRWVPPREMAARDAKARRWANGQPGGPDNPLGARALYLYQDGEDTLFRIHGTNRPDSIGRSVSSGCIRMLNAHVAELYDRVAIGTPVVVLAPGRSLVVSEAAG